MPDAAVVPRPNYGPKLVLGLAVVLVVPLVLILVVFPLILTQPFDRVEDLNPADVASLRVQVLDRQHLDNGPDIGPYVAAESAVPALLAVLKPVPEVDEFVDARGPLLGEYRILTTAGRKGTIRFYWQRPGGNPNAEPRLRFVIGPHKFEGGAAAGFIAAAADGFRQSAER